MHAKFVVCLLLVGRATTEHAGESGMQFSVGAEMEAYGDQAAATSNQFAALLGRSQYDCQHQVVQSARSGICLASTRVHIQTVGDSVR